MNAKHDLAHIPEIAPFLEGADHIDIKTITGALSLREFIAGTLSYQPGWVTFLYRIRWGFVRLLGMKQESIPQEPRLCPEDVPMTPGDDLAFFRVQAAQDDHYWVAGIDDTHLSAWLIVAVEPLADEQRRFHVITVVRYNNWAGPVYFNVIRPFHHLIVRQAIRAAIRDAARESAELTRQRA